MKTHKNWKILPRGKSQFVVRDPQGFSYLLNFDSVEGATKFIDSEIAKLAQTEYLVRYRKFIGRREYWPAQIFPTKALAEEFFAQQEAQGNDPVLEPFTEEDGQ